MQSPRVTLNPLKPVEPLKPLSPHSRSFCFKTSFYSTFKSNTNKERNNVRNEREPQGKTKQNLWLNIVRRVVDDLKAFQFIWQDEL